MKKIAMAATLIAVSILFGCKSDKPLTNKLALDMLIHSSQYPQHIQKMLTKHGWCNSYFPSNMIPRLNALKSLEQQGYVTFEPYEQRTLMQERIPDCTVVVADKGKAFIVQEYEDYYMVIAFDRVPVEVTAIYDENENNKIVEYTEGYISNSIFSPCFEDDPPPMMKKKARFSKYEGSWKYIPSTD